MEVMMTKAFDSAEPLGSELGAELLVAGRQSLRKDFITLQSIAPQRCYFKEKDVSDRQILMRNHI